jgi:spore germination cell wall hydrolase CwlJ-like protein
MSRSKKVKPILLTACLSLVLSASLTVNAFAYTYTPGIAEYGAVSGDSLYKISLVFHTSIDNLMNMNNLKTYSLNVGQVLKVPGDTYTVQKGNTLFLITQKYKMPLSELQRANNIYGNNLNIGQRLAVPATSSSAPPANSGGSGSTSPAQTGTVSYTAADLDLLARLIQAEAPGQPYDAKVAVGAVVVNRVESGLFADSVSGVINQKINGYYQFTPVANGWINNPADTDAVNAAKEALKGTDPTNGALWYYDDSCTNSFMLAKKVAVKIGRMVFAY